jgi:hypothetical protein
LSTAAGGGKRRGNSDRDPVGTTDFPQLWRDVWRRRFFLQKGGL